MAGMLRNFPLEGYALSEEQKSMLWTKSEEACGKFSVLNVFFVDS